MFFIVFTEDSVRIIRTTRCIIRVFKISYKDSNESFYLAIYRGIKLKTFLEHKSIIQYDIIWTISNDSTNCTTRIIFYLIYLYQGVTSGSFTINYMRINFPLENQDWIFKIIRFTAIKGSKQKWPTKSSIKWLLKSCFSGSNRIYYITGRPM